MIDVRNYCAAELLKDGTPVTVRAIRPDDWSGVLAAFKALDQDSIYTRFFTYKKSLSDTELKQITEVDFDHVVALIATTRAGSEETLVGGGRYAVSDEPGPERSAELAFLTGADYRGRGAASLILKKLIEIGREAGLSTFDALVLTQNEPMLSVFRRCGLPMTLDHDGSVVHVALSLDTGGRS